MATLVLIISYLGSASGGLLGAIILYKHHHKSLHSDASALDRCLSNPTFAALMIIFLGAVGFWLPSTIALEFFEPVTQEVQAGDRS